MAPPPAPAQGCTRELQPPARPSKAHRRRPARRGREEPPEGDRPPHPGQEDAGSPEAPGARGGRGGGARSAGDAPPCTCGLCRPGAEDGPQEKIAALDQLEPADPRVAPELRGCVWALATSRGGSRVLQEVLERGDPRAKALLVEELRGHVGQAWQCEVAARYANFVVQKCVEVMPPKLCLFVKEEMERADVEQAARSKYGCRILQRLIEHFNNEDTEELLRGLLRERTLWGLMANKYGNFVVQCVLEHGSRAQRSLVAQVVLGLTEQSPEDELLLAAKVEKMPGGLERDYCRVAALASSMYASNVMQKAMMHCSEDEQRQIVRKVLDAERLPFLKRSRYGSFVTSEAQKLHDRLFGEA